MNRCPTCGNNIPPDAPGGMCPVCLYRIAAPEPDASPAARDRNLLFGVLGIQLRIIEAKSFIDAASAWAADPKIGVPERLQATGVIDEQQRQMLQGLVDEAVGHYGGDPVQALDALSGKGTLSLALTAAPDRQQAEHLATMLGLPPIIDDVRLDEEVPLREEPGRYTRTTPYSRGGMGQIFLVHDQYLNRDVALKELLPFGGTGKTPQTPVRASGAMAARFLREAKLTGQLEHPAIVPVYELGKRADGAFYYTMKLVRGTTFAARMGRAATLDDRLGLMPHFVDLCNAVGYAHSRHVIHRDLKPTNVLIGAFGETVLIDWGLAKVLGQDDPIEDDLRESVSEARPIEPGDPSSTKTGQLLGTPSYMSPEQARGDIPAIDARSDVFSLGIFLYELLTGRLPFKGKDTLDTVKAIQKGNATPPRQFEARIPPELESICMKALAPKPEDRFPDAAALRDELIRFQTGAIVRTYDYSTGEMVRRFYTRHRAPVNVAAVAAAALLLLGAVSYVNIRQSRDQAVLARDDALTARDAEAVARDTAERVGYINQVRLAQLYIDEGDFTQAQQLLWAAPPEQRNWEWGYLLNLAHPDAYVVEGRKGYAISRDGSRIAAHDFQADIEIRDGVSGELQRTIPLGAIGTVNTASFNADATRLFASVATGRLIAWDTDTGDVALDFAAHEGGFYNIDLSPEGNRLLTAGGDDHIRIWNPVDGQLLLDIAVDGEIPGIIERNVRFTDDGERIYASISGGEAKIWDAATGDLIATHAGGERAVAPDGTRIAIANGANVELWEAGANAPYTTLVGIHRRINTIAFSPSSDRLVVAGTEGLLVVWNLETGQQMFSRFIEMVIPGGAVWSPDGTLIAVMPFQRDTQLLDGVTGETVVTLPMAHAGLARIAFFQDSERLLLGGNSLWIWRVGAGSGQIRAALGTHKYNQFHLDDTAENLIVRDELNIVRVKQTATNTTLAAIGATALGTFGSVRLSRDGRRALIVADQFLPIAVNVGNSTDPVPHYGHDGLVTWLEWSEDGSEAVSASSEGRIHFWHPDTGALRLEIVHEAEPSALALSPDGNTLAVGDWDGGLVLYDAELGDRRTTLPVQNERVSFLAWNAAGNAVTVVAGSNLVTLNPTDGEVIARYSGHTAGSSNVRAVPAQDSARLFSTASDGIRVWDIVTQEQLLALTGRGQGGRTLFRRNDSLFTLPSHAETNYVSQWEAAPWREISTAPDPQSRFAAYRQQRRERVQQMSAPAATTEEQRFVTTLPRLTSAFERLQSALREMPDDDAPLIVAGPVADAVARVGIREGDLVRSIGGIDTPTASAALGQVDAALIAMAAPNPTLPMIQLDRGAVDIQLRYVTLVARNETRSITIPRARAAELFARLPQRLRQLNATSGADSRRLAAVIGEPLPEGADDAISGYFVSEGLQGEDYTAAREVGLAPFDRIVTLNGQPVNSMSQFLQNMEDIAEQIQAGSLNQLIMEIDRGEFQHYRLIYEFVN